MNHRRFEMKKHHIAMITMLDVSPQKLSFLGDIKNNKSPFRDFDQLDEALGFILVGKELSDATKKRRDKSGKHYLTRDRMDELLEIYQELPTALEIVLSNRSFRLGKYITRQYEINWKKDINKWES